MSASLVGSEMCIRDSSSSSRAPSAHHVPRVVRAPTCERSAVAGLSREPACLLYTSDAADDM
eukprot:15225392-Alexandrium_andersonii.AAC.1